MRINASKVLVPLVCLVGAFAFSACDGQKEKDSVDNKAAEETKASTESIGDPDSEGDKTALYNGTIIDGTGAVLEDGVILIVAGLIEKVGTADEIVIPDDYRKIDLNQRVVLPGFINTHVHEGYVEENLLNFLKGGVTTVRDLGASPSTDITALRDNNNQNADTARLLASSPILTVPDGYGHDYFNSPEEASELVNHYIDQGVDAIKFSIEDFQQAKSWKMPTDEELKAIVDTAHAGGKKTVAHITHAKFLEQATELGLDQIGHMVVEDLDEDICQMVVDHGMYWIPTLELWKGVSEAHGLNWDDVAVKNLGAFYQAGGKIALGTDFAGYFTEFDTGFPITEVTLMKEAGMSNMDIIIAGTRNAAEVCDRVQDLGTIEAGKIADLLIVEGDPLKQIEDLQNTWMVIHNGQKVNLD